MEDEVKDGGAAKPGETYQIKITFPVGVDLTREDQESLIEIADKICKRYEAQNPDRVMWPAGVGDEPVDIWGDEPKFDDSVFSIDVAERERYESDFPGTALAAREGRGG